MDPSPHLIDLVFHLESSLSPILALAVDECFPLLSAPSSPSCPFLTICWRRLANASKTKPCFSLNFSNSCNACVALCMCTVWLRSPIWTAARSEQGRSAQEKPCLWNGICRGRIRCLQYESGNLTFLTSWVAHSSRFLLLGEYRILRMFVAQSATQSTSSSL